jgi:lysozyme
MPGGLNVIVDISHNNPAVDFAQLQAAGVLGVIHKATQGLDFVDPHYAARRTAALSVGLLWGAYHFGTPDADGAQQADAFLKTVGDTTDTVLVLDFEDNPSGSGIGMSLQQARDFVTQVSQATGRYPGFYSGAWIKQLLGTKLDPVLAHCWFWLSQFGPNAVVPPNWTTWKLWQYTDGTIGPLPHEFPGSAAKFDRDFFNGSADDLHSFWGT